MWRMFCRLFYSFLVKGMMDEATSPSPTPALRTARSSSYFDCTCLVCALILCFWFLFWICKIRFFFNYIAYSDSFWVLPAAPLS